MAKFSGRASRARQSVALLFPRRGELRQWDRARQGGADRFNQLGETLGYLRQAAFVEHVAPS